jgi:hypothetical protein
MDFGGAQASQGAGYSVADVGDVNGTGYDDIVIGSPTVGSTPQTIGTGAGSAVYLIFGSQTVNVSTVTDWIGQTNGLYNYTPSDRVGDLGQLTNQDPGVQTDPITSAALAFPFPGIEFVDTVSAQSMLGASVAGVRLGDGQGGILIGAPGALDENGANPGTGRAYLIFGTPTGFNRSIGKTVNLDDPNFATDHPGLNLVTFVSTATGGQLGASVAGGSNIFGDGSPDIILGAPSATVASSSPTPGIANTGVVYVMSTALLTGGTQTINVQTAIGQSGTQSVILAGANSGDKAGFSVADAGDANGATAAGVNVDDILVGAPQASSSAGAAYLVYGGSGLAGLATTTNGVRYINLSLVGTTSAGAVPGAVITGPADGSETGYSVSSAGDFNGDGFSDILIGSPDFSSGLASNDQGEVTLLYGASSTSSASLTGTIDLSSIPSAIQSVTFTGANAGDMAGYALSFVGFINVGQPNEILIGAPGYNTDAGTAYLIPGRAGFTGSYSLAAEASAPISGLQFVLTTAGSPSGTPSFFGASVSSRFQDTSVTFDSSSFAGFVIGAPGYDVSQNSSRTLGGGAMVVEGGLITVPIPPTVAASQVVISSTPLDITADSRGQVTLQLEGPSGDPATSTGSQTISLSTSSSTGAFYLTQSSTSPITTVVIPAGRSSTSFYYSDAEAGTPTVTAADMALSSAPSQQETINALLASQMVITSPALDITAGNRGHVTMQIEDSSGEPAVSTSSQTINLGTTSGSGAFFASPPSIIPITSIVIPAGQTIASFYYYDTHAGVWSLTASDTALASAPTQQATVSPAAASLLVLHTQPSSSATAGVAFTTQPVVYEEDHYGNLETSDSHTVVSASLAAGSGPLQGTTTATASGGIATFANLADNTVETISLEFISDHLSKASDSIVVTAAPATHLVVATQPPGPINPGQGFTLAVWAEDKFNNIDTNYNGSVSLSLPGDPSFGASVQAKNGVATFTGLTASASLSGQAIRVSAPGLSGTTTDPLNVNPAPTVMLETVVYTQKRYKKGKPVGKPIFSGFAIQYNTAMNSRAAGLADNYHVFSAVVKKGKKKTSTTFKPVSFSVTYSPTTDSVTLNVKNATPFAKGGELTISGVTSEAGVLLNSSDTVLSILPKAKNITLA